MALWGVRAAGKTNENNRDIELNKGYCVIGWSEIKKNIKDECATIHNLNQLFIETYKDDAEALSKKTRCINQIWDFIHSIQQNDIIATSLSEQRVIRFGQIIGEYEYKKHNLEFTEHCRQIKWLKTVSFDAINEEYIKEFHFRGTVKKIGVSKNKRDINQQIEEYILHNFLK